MSRKQRYGLIHKTAKLIVAILVVGLIAINRSVDCLLLDAITVVIWVFGTNFIAHCIELLFKLRRQHPWL